MAALSFATLPRQSPTSARSLSSPRGVRSSRGPRCRPAVCAQQRDVGGDTRRPPPVTRQERSADSKARAEVDDNMASRRGVLKTGASLGLGGLAARFVRVLGIEGAAVESRIALSAAERLLVSVEATLKPSVEQLLKMGLKPEQVWRMVQNPALRPKNAAALRSLIG